MVPGHGSSAFPADSNGPDPDENSGTVRFENGQEPCLHIPSTYARPSTLDRRCLRLLFRWFWLCCWLFLPVLLLVVMCRWGCRIRLIRICVVRSGCMRFGLLWIGIRRCIAGLAR